MPKINDAKDLEPIVEAKCKTMYDNVISVTIKDSRIVDKNYYVRADCKDGKKCYTVSLSITPDGEILKAEESGRLLYH